MTSTETYQQTDIPWMKEIPSHWNNYALWTLFIDNKVKNKNNDIPIVLSLSYGNIVRRDVDSNMGLLPKSFSTYQILNSDYIVLRLTDLQNDKRSLRVGIAEETGIITSAYTGLKPNKEKVHPKYFYYTLHSFDIKKVFYGLGSGVRQSLGFKELKWLRLPIPPLPEQKVIANYLDSQIEKIIHFIKKKEALIELLKEQRQGVINKAVTKGINPNVSSKSSGIDWLGEIPEHWNLRRLRYCGTVQNGLNKGGEYFGKGYPFFGYGDIYNNEVLPENPEGLVQSNDNDQVICSVNKGDVFFTRTSETVDEIAFASTCHKSIESATFSGFLIRFRPLDNIITPEYSTYYFRSQILRNYFVKEINIMTRASLSQDTLKNLWIVLPPEDEQIEISKFIKTETTKIDQAITKAEQEISLIKEYKEAMIAEAVLGKLAIGTK